MNFSYDTLQVPLFIMLNTLLIYLIWAENLSPLDLLAILFIYIIFSSILVYLFSLKSIHCFMIFISMVSGTMVLFLYFTSLMNNFKNELPTWVPKLILAMTIIMMISTVNLMKKASCLIYKNMKFPFNVHQIYLFPLNILAAIMMIHLLIILFLAIKICMKKYSPMRKTKN